MADRFKSDHDDGNQVAPAALPTPAKENDWLGFCQSAIKLQNGDRKVRLAAIERLDE